LAMHYIEDSIEKEDENNAKNAEPRQLTLDDGPCPLLPLLRGVKEGFTPVELSIRLDKS